MTISMNGRGCVHLRPGGQDATSEADMTQSLANLVRASMFRLLRVQKFFFFFFLSPSYRLHLFMESLYTPCSALRVDGIPQVSIFPSWYILFFPLF